MLNKLRREEQELFWQTSLPLVKSNNLFMEGLSRLLDQTAKLSLWGGVVLLFSLMIFTFVAVVMRYFFNSPFSGDLEITQMLSVGIVWLGIAWGQVKKSHISVTLFTSRLSPTNQMVFETATLMLLLGVAAVITWQGALNTLYFVDTNRVSQHYRFMLSPMAAVVASGAFIYFLILLRDFVHNLRHLSNKVGFKTYGLMIGVPLCILVCEHIFMQSRGILEPMTVAVIAIVFGLALIFLGMPIGPALAMMGFVFVGNLMNPQQGFGLAGADLFWLSTDYTWSTIILFMLMSQLIVISGIGEEAFNTAYKWFGHFPGGLAIATIAACVLLAAVIGIPAPAILAMGGIALPAMRKHKYSDSLAAGSIAAGSALGPLIPPSVSFIIYGVITGVPISHLFIAGIIPGVLLAFGFMVTTYFSCRMDPAFGPAGEKANWGERFRSLNTSLPIFVLITVVLGGIYLGVFTTTEGGGIGAFMALVIVFVLGRLTWPSVKDALLEATRINAVLIFMILGSMVFGRILTVSNLGGAMENSLGGVSPALIVLAVLLFYFLIGFIADTITVLLLTLPVLAPLLTAAGVDMLWFGVLVISMCNLGAFTPPYGLILFILSGSTNLKLGDVYKGVLPFVICNLLLIVFLFFFPEVVTWLPGKIGN